ncbi:FUSC family protein [Helicobacter sp. MIT 21-1697]|uniref:FUSC family protein n=1 Tax=Helicobacter sp. MIT 21-1697 TaxID=2993733 RepID=UPI00224B561E|nr:FUSC family protein [Helicobacter sp. MIT 21-1697]MCX2717850.1 FUSC family protein [Helicobacter sp. MIT 21-1697]
MHTAMYRRKWRLLQKIIMHPHLLSSLHNLVFKRFIYVYDAGFFGLIYAIKAMIALCISGAICYALLGAEVLIWSVMMAMYVFFLNGFRSNKDMDWKYLVLFVGFVCALIPIFGIWEESLWLIIPSMILAFGIGISEVYDSDLPKVLTLALINALVANIYAGSHPETPLWQCVAAAFIGGGVSIGIRLFISFGQYGRFIQTQFVAMLFELSMMSENLGTKDYDTIKTQTLNHISLLKSKLTSASAKIKDAHLIKNHKRALFYLYKLESVCYVLDLMNYYFLHHRSTLLLSAQKEMTKNLNELSHIFYGKKPSITKQSLHNAMESNADSEWINALKIFYSKIESFTRVSSLQSQAFVENTTPKSLKNMRDSLTDNPYPLFYGIRYAGAIGIAMFFAQFFQINHGAWIALGVVTMMHPNIGTIKTNGKDSILGSLIGLLLGVGLVLVAWDSPLLYIIFVFNLFLVVYFKTYPFVLWSLVFMLEFVLMFALVDNNFIELIAYRFGDILLGFLFAFCISKILYPRYSADELLPQIKLCLEYFGALTLDLEDSQNKVLQRQNKLVRSLDELSILIEQSQNDKKLYSPHILKLFDTLMQDFYHLKEALILLCEKLADKEKSFDSLLKNDLKALRLRFLMLCAMIESQPYYFKTDEDDRFLLKDEHIYPIVREIFELQNRLYDFLHTTLGK